MSGSSTLRIIVWRGYDDREAAAPVLEECGLSIDVTYVDADEKTVDALRHGGLGRVDLVAIDNRYLPLMREYELLVPLDPSHLPNAADLFETFITLGRSEDGRTWSIPYLWGRHPMPYNAAFVPEPPTSWLDVLQPRYRGHVAMLDSPVNQIIIWGRVLGYRHPATITQAQLAEAVELAVRVKRESQALLAEWDELPTLLARGDSWIATAGWEAIARFASKLGADVRLSYPKEEAYPWMDSWCLPRDAPNEEAAYAWINWMIGPQAQAVVCRNLLCGTVNARAVEQLDPSVGETFPHERLNEFFAPGMYVGIPPLESKGDLTTLADWNEAWEEVRAA